MIIYSLINLKSAGLYSHLFNDDRDDHYHHHDIFNDEYTLHDHHHHHHNLDLLDFITSKTKISSSDNNKNSNFMGNLLGTKAGIFDPDQHYLPYPYNHNHHFYHDHYNNIMGHHLDHYNHYNSPYGYSHHYENHHYGNNYDYEHHHYSHGHHIHTPSSLNLELQQLHNYIVILKQRLNYYTVHNMSPPLALLNEYNHINQLITTKTMYLPEHPHYSYDHHYESGVLHHPSLQEEQQHGGGGQHEYLHYTNGEGGYLHAEQHNVMPYMMHDNFVHGGGISECKYI